LNDEEFVLSENILNVRLRCEYLDIFEEIYTQEMQVHALVVDDGSGQVVWEINIINLN
jgi:hypothetical protein